VGVSFENLFSNRLEFFNWNNFVICYLIFTQFSAHQRSIPCGGNRVTECYCPLLKKVMLFEVIEGNKNSKENGYFSISSILIRISKFCDMVSSILL